MAFNYKVSFEFFSTLRSKCVESESECNSLIKTLEASEHVVAWYKNAGKNEDGKINWKLDGVGSRMEPKHYQLFGITPEMIKPAKPAAKTAAVKIAAAPVKDRVPATVVTAPKPATVKINKPAQVMITLVYMKDGERHEGKLPEDQVQKHYNTCVTAGYPVFMLKNGRKIAEANLDKLNKPVKATVPASEPELHEPYGETDWSDYDPSPIVAPAPDSVQPDAQATPAAPVQTQSVTVQETKPEHSGFFSRVRKLFGR